VIKRKIRDPALLRIRIWCFFESWIRDPLWKKIQSLDPGSGIELLKRGVSYSLSYGENLEDMRLADWNIEEICGFAMCRIAIQNCEFSFFRLAR
jgi:hypothetical protein